MTRDDAAVLDGLTTGTIPTPRTAGAPRRTPWPEPWQFSRSSRPGTEYWDVESARWVSRPTVPGPRRGH